MTEQESLEKLRAKVESEIKDHPKWCHRDCRPGNTFLPDAYREARLVHGYSAKTVQDDYDLCHIYR